MDNVEVVDAKEHAHSLVHIISCKLYDAGITLCDAELNELDVLLHGLIS